MRLSFLLLALALGAASASAQAHERDGEAVTESAPPPGDTAPAEAPSPAPSAAPEAPPPPPDTSMPAGTPEAAEAAADTGPAPMSLEDAKVNMPTVIEAFIEKQSPRGFWPLRDKRNDKLLKLKLVSIDTKHAVDKGDRVFTAPAELSDVDSGEKVPVVFTVDFGGTEWKVSSMKMLRKKPAAKKKTAAR